MPEVSISEFMYTHPEIAKLMLKGQPPLKDGCPYLVCHQIVQNLGHTQRTVSGPAVVASPESLEMQNPRPHPKLTQSEKLHFNKIPR